MRRVGGTRHPTGPRSQEIAMSAYVPTARTAVPQPLGIPRAATSARVRQPATPRRPDPEAQRREIERVERQRAQAERVRDNMAARHPLSLR
jgi:hypothetical protein